MTQSTADAHTLYILTVPVLSSRYITIPYTAAGGPGSCISVTTLKGASKPSSCPIHTPGACMSGLWVTATVCVRAATPEPVKSGVVGMSSSSCAGGWGPESTEGSISIDIAAAPA